MFKYIVLLFFTTVSPSKGQKWIFPGWDVTTFQFGFYLLETNTSTYRMCQKMLTVLKDS